MPAPRRTQRADSPSSDAPENTRPARPRTGAANKKSSVTNLVAEAGRSKLVDRAALCSTAPETEHRNYCRGSKEAARRAKNIPSENMPADKRKNRNRAQRRSAAQERPAEMPRK